MTYLIEGIKSAAFEIVVAILIILVIGGMIAFATLVGGGDNQDPPMYGR